jgi:hypothetical protein
MITTVDEVQADGPAALELEQPLGQPLAAMSAWTMASTDAQ